MTLSVEPLEFIKRHSKINPKNQATISISADSSRSGSILPLSQIPSQRPVKKVIRKPPQKKMSALKRRTMYQDKLRHANNIRSQVVSRTDRNSSQFVIQKGDSNKVRVGIPNQNSML